MKTQPYVGQYESLMFATVAYQVAMGLGAVKLEGALPVYYRGVFRMAVILCREIVEDAYYVSNHENPCRENVIEKSGATIWFSNLAKKKKKIYKALTYDDVVNAADTLEYLARDETVSNGYPEKWIDKLQTFFLNLWLAASAECIKEGLPTALDLANFPTVSSELQ